MIEVNNENKFIVEFKECRLKSLGYEWASKNMLNEKIEEAIKIHLDILSEAKGGLVFDLFKHFQEFYDDFMIVWEHDSLGGSFYESQPASIILAVENGLIEKEGRFEDNDMKFFLRGIQDYILKFLLEEWCCR